MPWTTGGVSGVTSSDGAIETVEWRSRQEQSGQRRYHPQRRPSEPVTPASEPASGSAPVPHAPASPPGDDDPRGHLLNVLA